MTKIKSFFNSPITPIIEIMPQDIITSRGSTQWSNHTTISHISIQLNLQTMLRLQPVSRSTIAFAWRISPLTYSDHPSKIHCLTPKCSQSARPKPTSWSFWEIISSKVSISTIGIIKMHNKKYTTSKISMVFNQAISPYKIFSNSRYPIEPQMDKIVASVSSTNRTVTLTQIKILL